MTEDLAEEEETPRQQAEPVVIKASKKSMRYHTPDSPYYNRVSASLTFISPEEAELARLQGVERREGHSANRLTFSSSTSMPNPGPVGTYAVPSATFTVSPPT
ncbi:sunset domain-containing protein [Kibdelosporangium aridum]|uniref:sunset domain-containing protein n=1 Tax=Kibdelosporangium aridum TaxID=2030 RepID=UPI0035EB4777